MSFYRPGSEYDTQLLNSAPIVTGTQEIYDVSLLAIDNNRTPSSSRTTVAAVDGHSDLEAGVPPTKEDHESSYSVPWYRQKKWRAVMLVAATIITGAVVGCAVGGALVSQNTSRPNFKPTLTVTISADPFRTSTGPLSTNAHAGSTTTDPSRIPPLPSKSSSGPPTPRSSPPPGTSDGPFYHTKVALGV